MFDVYMLLEVPQSPDVPDGAPLHGCTRTDCRDMSTDIEKALLPSDPWKLYKQYGIHAMLLYILDEGFLQLAHAALNDIFAIDDDQARSGAATFYGS